MAELALESAAGMLVALPKSSVTDSGPGSIEKIDEKLLLRPVYAAMRAKDRNDALSTSALTKFDEICNKNHPMTTKSEPGLPLSLVPNAKRPFLIVTPPYTRLSAGVTALHLLCHYLNVQGHQAFIFHYPPADLPVRSLPFFVTQVDQPEIALGFQAPIATQAVLDAYVSANLMPIVIYPEVFDNPLNVPFFGRYILNYPGLLAPKYKERENFSFAYSKVLAEHTTREYPGHPPCTDVLFMPTVDLTYWREPEGETRREGACFYAGKLKGIHKAKDQDFADKGTEILRSGQMSRSQVKDIFQRSKTFFCYEDTALAIEAELCGCRTVFVPNSHFQGPPLAAHELGWMRDKVPSDRTDEAASHKDFRSIIQGHIASAPAKISALATRWEALADVEKPAGALIFERELHLLYVRGGLALQEEGETAKLKGSMGSGIHAGALRRIVRAIRRDGSIATANRVLRSWRRHGFFRSVRILVSKIKGRVYNEKAY